MEAMILTGKAWVTSATSSARPSGRSRSPRQPLDGGGVGLAAALAHGLEAVAAADRVEVVAQRRGDAHAGGPQGMADGDGAAARIEAIALGQELPGPHQGDGG